jgi:hypothetical protein
MINKDIFFFDNNTNILIQQSSYKKDLGRDPNYNKVLQQRHPTDTTEMAKELIPPAR